MNITLVRTYTDDCTEGSIYDDQGQFICYSLELPNLNNAPEISCIPEGCYSFATFLSDHLGKVYRLSNVPGRSLIDIHSANFTSELLGCIAVGKAFATFPNGQFGITNSKATLQKLFDIVGESGTINISSLTPKGA